MRVRPPPTFAQRLIFYGLSIAVPVLAMCGILVYHYTAEQYRAIEHETLAAARQLAKDLEKEIQSQLLLAETLSGLLGPEMDLARLHRNAMRALVPHGSHVVVYDVEGWQILNTAVPMGSPLPVDYDRALVKQIIDRGKPHVSNFKARLIDGSSSWSVCAPIYRDGQVVGLIGIARSPEELTEVLRHESRPDTWRWYVVDRADTVVASSDGNTIGRKMPERFGRASQGESGVDWIDYSGGEPIIRAFVRSDFSGWLAAVAVPTAVIQAPLREAWMLFAIGSALLLALALIVATSVARRLHANVDILVHAAEKLGRGDPLPSCTFATREFQHIYDALACAAAERERNEHRRHLLLRELQHRTNNLLAVIASIARRTLQEGKTIPEVRDALLGRLQSLANASDTLAAAHWQGADMRLVIENEMRVFAGRYSASGPELLLSAQAAQNTSLAIHELATNASKYGALSQPNGHVTIEWRIEGEATEPMLVFEWIERGGPPATPPSRQGFGHTLLQTVLSDAEFKPEIRFEPEGLHYRATVRLSAVLADTSQVIPQSLSGVGPSGKH